MCLHNTPVNAEFQALNAAIESATRAIPPVWPLASSVAVNPFLGQAHDSLATVGARMARTAGAAVTMPRAWYLERISSRQISDEDLDAALATAPAASRPSSLAAFRSALLQTAAPPKALPTMADLAAEVSGIDWPAVIAERIGSWAAGYFDQGQALWSAPRSRNAYAAWRAFATHDLTPEILGLKGFAQHVADAPLEGRDLLCRAVAALEVPADAMATYLHQLLMTLGAWAQYARYKLWKAELAAAADPIVADFMAIRLIWEEALAARYGVRIAARWRQVLALHALPVAPTHDQVLDAMLQEALERSEQRALRQRLATPTAHRARVRPVLQAIFCIDVRSEPFRRSLEAVHPDIQTIGFAGFFGMRAAHRRFASDVEELRLPVLLDPDMHSCTGGKAQAEADRSARISARASRAWGRFRLAAVSSFAFVEAMGPWYAAKLLRDSLGRPSDSGIEAKPQLVPELDRPARTAVAESVLRAMSLTGNFARLVLVTGHGARVVNNPFASALQCGACGGHSGEVNARLLASLLNDPEVRGDLLGKGIAIPPDTLFLGALHDTTSDEVRLFAQDHAHASHAPDLALCMAWLAKAGAATRDERARHLPRAANPDRLWKRSRDWAEVRPELGLAGCNAFIAAPRERTAGRSFEGRAFLHDYDWRQDRDFAVLELILTAPVVVASWISLQYYGSTVAPQVFGSGNKLLHNVVGGVGVVEGNGGLLRAGLPWQSVHDGARCVHTPLRLSVCIEAPAPAIVNVLARHVELRALFDNRWLHLFALDEQGRMTLRYAGNLGWVEDYPGDGLTRADLLKVAV